MQIKETLNRLYYIRKEWLALDPNTTEESLKKCPVAEVAHRTMHALWTPRARYAYTVDANVTELVKAAFKIATAYSDCLSPYYIVKVDTAYHIGDSKDELIDVSVLASLNEVSAACSAIEEDYAERSIAYEKHDTENNAYVYVPDELFYTSTFNGQDTTYMRPIRIIMFRNSNRNDHINDACTVLANKLINYINESEFTIHKFTNDELMILDAVECPDVDTFYTMLSNMFDARSVELTEAAERTKQELQEKFYAKLDECAKEYVHPYVTENSDRVPLNNGDLTSQYRDRIESITRNINDFYREIGKLYLQLDKVNNELKATMFQPQNSLHDKLVQTLNSIYEAPNSFLQTYDLSEEGRLKLMFIAPVLYWEADEVEQWSHSSWSNAKYVKLITSKRFQLWCNACVDVSNNGLAGYEYETYGVKDLFNLDNLKPDTDVEDFIKTRLADYSRSNIESFAGYKYYGHTIKHGHVGRYSCFGNNEPTIIKAFREGNYDLAINVIIHCVTQINLTDGIVVEWFCNKLDRDSTKCILDTETNTWYAPREALAILEGRA